MNYILDKNRILDNESSDPGTEFRNRIRLKLESGSQKIYRFSKKFLKLNLNLIVLLILFMN